MVKGASSAGLLARLHYPPAGPSTHLLVPPAVLPLSTLIAAGPGALAAVPAPALAAAAAAGAAVIKPAPVIKPSRRPAKPDTMK